MGRMSASGRATRGVGWEAQRASQQGQKMEMKTDAPCPEPFRPRGLRTQQSSSCPLGTVFGKPGFGDHRSMLQVRQLGPPPVLWLVTCNKEYAMNQWQWCLFGWNVLAIQFLSFFKRDTMIELSLCVAGCRPRTNLGKFNRAWWTSNVTAGAMAGAHEIFFGRQLFSWKNQLLNIVAGARAGECVVWKCALQVAFLNWTCLSGSKHEKGSRLQGWLLMVSWPNHSGIIHQVMLGLSLHCQFATTFFHLFRKVAVVTWMQQSLMRSDPRNRILPIVNDVWHMTIGIEVALSSME